MTPPPNPSDANSNTDDPFGGMDPMAWLESLAKRQGANPDQLTTAANIDVPMPPADAKIQGPGYTPGYDVGKLEAAAAAASAAAQPPKAQPVAQQPVVQQPVAAKPVTPPPAPPAPAASSDDPFGGMDPMAWLESLAKRQGADPNQLTTAANIDVPMPPADTKIEGPGYTPGYDVGKLEAAAAVASAAQAKAPPTAAPPVTPRPTVQAATPPQPAIAQPVAAKPVTPPPTPPAPATSSDDPFGGMDPMAWLESLAKRQGADPNQLTTAANIDVPMPPADTKIEGPGYTPGYDVGKLEAAAAVVSAAQAKAPPTAAPPAVTPPVSAKPATEQPIMQQSVIQQPAATSDDPFGGMDPMTWLESLAKRQGASEDEFTTAANINVPMPPADSFVEGPGYSDYVPYGESAPQSEAIDTMSTAEAAALLGLDVSSRPIEANPLNEMDPLAWLESLASSQSSSPTDFSAFEKPSMETSEAMEAASALSWLEQLASENQNMPLIQSADESSLWAETTPIADSVDSINERADETGGLSNDANELQSWLNRQAGSLASIHDGDELYDDTDSLTANALSEAEPADLPSWLLDQMPSSVGQRDLFSDQIAEPPTPDDLPAWLNSNFEPALDDNSTIDPSEFFGTPAVSTSEPSSEADLGDMSMLTMPQGFDVPDSLAEALDVEYERKLAGAEDAIPDWYAEALSRFEGGDSPVAEIAAPQADILPADELPSWLTDMEAPADPEPATATRGDIPAWLLQAAPGSFDEPTEQPQDDLFDGFDSTSFNTPFDAEAVPALAEDEQSDIDLPDWLQASLAESAVVETPPPVAQAAPPVERPIAAPAEKVGQALPEPVAATPAPTPAVSAAQPVQAPPQPTPQPTVAAPTAAPVTPEIAANHAQRLRHARELVSQNRHMDSLTHYESLIDDNAALDDVITDMRTLVSTQPKEPRVRRLLGDAHLRQGNLQEALDTYRGALDQL